MIKRRKYRSKVAKAVREGVRGMHRLGLVDFTFAEIRFGIERLADATRRAELNDWLMHKVRPMFEQRVLPVTEDVMFKWRLLTLKRHQDSANFAERLRGLTCDFETWRQHSMKRSTTGLRVRFLSVPITNGHGRLGRATASLFSDRL